jgi:hypothetical protein
MSFGDMLSILFGLKKPKLIPVPANNNNDSKSKR